MSLPPLTPSTAPSHLGAQTLSQALQVSASPPAAGSSLSPCPGQQILPPLCLTQGCWIPPSPFQIPLTATATSSLALPNCPLLGPLPLWVFSQGPLPVCLLFVCVSAALLTWET